MKRMSAAAREENYEHVLMCLICRSLFDDHEHQPKFLPCHHTFCKECLREYVRQSGDDIECPSCRKVATIPTVGVAALQTNFYIKYIQTLVQGGFGADGNSLECGQHPGEVLKYFCKDCSCSICDKCCASCEKANCYKHNRLPVTAVAEASQQKIDKAFAKSNALIERKKVELQAMMKALSDEKDQALLKIDSTFEQHAHTLNRRTTLLKNKVIDIYNEHMVKLEADMEDISTALTCIVSLKEFQETAIAKADFSDIDNGISELEEVHVNISEKIQPRENHIIFEDKHGIDKYKISVRDLGRVRCSRPTIPRSEPEGNDAIPNTISPSSPQQSDSDSPASSYALPIPLTATNSMSSSQILSLKPNTDCPTSNPSMSDSTFLLKTSGESAVEKRQGSAHSTAAATSDGASAESAETSTSSVAPQTSEKPVMVVRPKTLSNPSGILKRPEKPNVSRSAKIKPITNAAMMSIQAQLANGAWAFKDDGDGGQCPDERNGVALSLGMSRSYSRAEDDRRRQDKMYHHLVYTSYDEEELLKELQAGKVQVDVVADARLRRSVEETDSWMTVSSDGDSTLSGNSDEASRDTTVL